MPDEPELARTLMVQGTASAVGKSLLVTALCRLFRQRGVRVAPFKGQNIALNSHVTPDGLEIGRAQAAQAEAAGIPAQVEMNPVLIKPEPGMGSQTVLLGKPATGELTRERLAAAIDRSLRRLRAQFDLVLIEGAGSPAEVNLRDRDIVNMHVAKLADAPVLLVGDIDLGGVFASLVGTLELLLPEERTRVAGLVINKFRGDPSQLVDGLAFLEQRTGVPVVGVLPYVRDLRLADEDSVVLDGHRGRRAPLDGLDLAVIRFPSISNHDDFDPFEHEPGVGLRYVERPCELGRPDLVVLPGSKSTLADLTWLRARGFAPLLAERFDAGLPVLGICGGCQMLGRRIDDPDRVESELGSAEGLGALPLVTRYEATKRTQLVSARVGAACFLTEGVSTTETLSGYHIHMGRVAADHHAPFELLDPEPGPDGAVKGAVVGTMLHGLFENESVRSALLAHLRARRGLPAPAGPGARSREESYDRLAAVVAEGLDLELLDRIIG